MEEEKRMTEEQIIEEFEKTKYFSIMNYILENQKDFKKIYFEPTGLQIAILKLSFEKYSIKMVTEMTYFRINFFSEDIPRCSKQKVFYKIFDPYDDWLFPYTKIYEYLFEKVENCLAYKIEREYKEEKNKELNELFNNFEGTL
jgi:hypothetical protein